MSAVIVSLRVAASPEEAFDIFTAEIAAWWQPSALFQLTPRGDGTLSFEEEVRLITTLPNGKVFEIGRVTAWQRGQRLAFSWRQATFTPDQITHVDVHFEAVGEETRVTVEHRGWDTIPQEHVARHGFPLAATQMRLAEYWRAQLAALSRARRSP
ncbi:ATPase [Hyphomonas sp. CACIAM 19H1]|uniref:SRPBCC domain-containing protein n=1 Tax=Hyphomonas sp. CACIAM 19H1 TaxID=1873716 RepID=UPI000DEDA5FB|nr:SRPBCC domain-containing protein [Hyphomonas sp. CACIAM 19H1]AXE62903.1 ATPase [Hyphomonas sp. CACIAM 19H1]